MSKFLVTGLPRSRTAWMAEFLGCPHEPIEHMDTLADLNRFYEDNDGASDHGLGLCLGHLISNFAVRVLIIDRPREEVARSFAGLGFNLPDTNFLDILGRRLDEWRSHPLVMSVPFNALGEMRVMQKAFWHLKPGAPFDEGRYNELKDRKICKPPVLPSTFGKLAFRLVADELEIRP